MKQELISVVKSFISNDEVEYTFSKMCIERVPLHYANNTLYNKLSDLVDDFIADNDLQDDWFEKTFLSIDDLFEYLID